ncbi:MAG: RnfABCDGE type electron transport complex subunit D [Planctomycetales bacterium]|nr:RnfABCDGE type electron transport complex subunit D [Planctomycetales bacterium]
MLSKITVSPAPHISQKRSTRGVMLDVIIGLSPAMAAALYFFRVKAAMVMAVCVVSCLFVEWICGVLRKKPHSLGDLSAVVTGLILAMSLPPAIPLWAVVIGAAFAIVICKMLFGGLGANIFNPAMAARAFLSASFGVLMTTWTVPATIAPDLPQISATQTTAVTQATPLAWAKSAIQGKADVKEVNAMLKSAFLGSVGGCLGETSALALLIGGAYLLIRRTITFHIPAAVLIAAFVFAEIFYLINPDKYSTPFVQLFSGGMLICAFFIATDPVTAPLSTKGMWIFGAGVGALIMLIRFIGEYPEGVMYAVLIMNAVSPLIDRACKLIPAGGKPNVK